MKILTVGNSFSQDPHAYLHDLALSCGVELDVYNLFIGGCPLRVHAAHLKDGEAAYSLEINGETVRPISIPEALAMEKWDAITTQQVSGKSGRYETYQPYLDELIAAFRAACPEAKLYFQKTWAYETDSDHKDFARYGNDQHLMFGKITEANDAVSVETGLPLIPTGDVIQYLRGRVPAFDRENGGMSLNRDGYHLSLTYGRLAAAATWLAFFTDADLNKATFRPEGCGDEELVRAVFAAAEKFARRK